MHNLNQINNQHEELLKSFGINLNDIPTEIDRQLNECIKIKELTKLSNLDKTYMDEWYFSRKKSMIDKRLFIHTMKQEIIDLQKQIADEENEMRDFQNFLNFIAKNVKSDDEIYEKIKKLDQSYQCCVEKESTLPTIPNIDYLEILNKIKKL